MQALTISQRIAAIQQRIADACGRVGRAPEDVTLVVISKGFGPEAVREAVAAGILHIGENRVQEAEAKRRLLSDLPDGVTWHMIGHLQTNKVKAALDTFDIIQSVDSLHLASAISQRASRPVPAFLEVNVVAEASKSGFSLKELPSAFEQVSRLPNLDVRGLMTVAPLVSDTERARPILRRLRSEAESLGVRALSMGMTGDFEVAIEEGATHVRIGRAIFGERV